MASLNFSIFRKIYSRGFSWFLARCLQKTEEGISFSAKICGPLMNALHLMVLYPVNKIIFFKCWRNFGSDTLFVFYDLEIAPVTFDFSWTLILAEQQRRERGLTNISVILVPGKYHGLRREASDYEQFIDLDARYWRRREILLSMCDILPTCTGMTLCTTRKESWVLCEKMRPNIFPKRYTTMFPITHSLSHLLAYSSQDVMAFRATAQSKRYIEKWLEPRLAKRKLITITLRNSSYMPVRNSCILAWAAFVKKLDLNEFLPVFLPDTDNAFQPPPPELDAFTFFTEPAWNINLRAALYELSYLNLGVNNGSMVLCWLNAACRYITFKMIVPEAPQTTELAMKMQGFRIGESLPFATSMQKWVWENDDCHVIEREFEKMVRHIDSTILSINNA